MRVTKWVMPVLVLVLLLGTVGIARSAGLWATTGRQAGTGQGTGQGQGGGDGTGTTQVVKGWMSIAEAAEASGVPVTTAVALTGAADPAAVDPTTPLNQLEDLVPGFSVSAYRTALAAAAADAGGAGSP